MQPKANHPTKWRNLLFRARHDSSISFSIQKMTFLSFLMLLWLASWLGGLIFFPVVAQTAFSALPSTHLAALVVGSSLRSLHRIGFISGTLFLASSLLYNRKLNGNFRPLAPSHVLILAMLALTAISQFRIIPSMDAIRVSAGEIAALPANNPLRTQFDSLHVWSTRLEGTVLILGLIALYATARRFNSSRT